MKIQAGKLKAATIITGLSKQRLSDYAATRRRPSRRTAQRLEDSLGIPARLWLFGSSQDLKAAISNLITTKKEAA